MDNAASCASIIRLKQALFLKKKCFISFLTKPNTDLKQNWGTLVNLNPIIMSVDTHKKDELQIKKDTENNHTTQNWGKEDDGAWCPRTENMSDDKKQKVHASSCWGGK